MSYLITYYNWNEDKYEVKEVFGDLDAIISKLYEIEGKLISIVPKD